MTSILHKATLVYLAVTALFLSYLGMNWGFFPTEHMARVGITADNIAALNTLKSVMGTALLGIVAACILFIFDQEKWYRTLVLLGGIMAFVRITSLIVDGFHSRMALYAALEILIVVAALAGAKLRPGAQKA